MMRHWYKSTLKVAQTLILLLLMPLMAQAGVFDYLYKLPNAQTATDATNHKANVLFQVTQTATTDAGKQLLRYLKANQSNSQIEHNISPIKEQLTKALNQNDPIAQVIQGMMYYYGWQTNQNNKAAYVQLQKASQQGEGQADNLLSELLNDGKIAPKDDISYQLNQLHKQPQKKNIVTLPNGSTKDLGFTTTAMQGIKLIESLSSNPQKAQLQRAWHYIKQGQKRNHPESIYKAGIAHRIGQLEDIGIKKDETTGYALIDQAAELNWPNALYEAATLHTIITGIKDAKKAEKYLDKLIATKDMHYAKAWAMKVRVLYDQKKMKQGKALAQKGWALSNHQSSSLAAVNGLFFNPKTKEGILKKEEWAEKAYAVDNPKINEPLSGLLYLFLGQQYLSGQLSLDLVKGKKWIQRSINEATAGAYNVMGVICDGEYGGEKDLKCAVSNYKKGADMLNPTAMQNLAINYYKGNGVLKNFNKSISLTKKAAFMGYVTSMTYLAYLYEKGKGIKKNNAQCYLWAQLSKIRNTTKMSMANNLIKSCGSQLSSSKQNQLNHQAQQLNRTMPKLYLGIVTIFKG